MSSLGQISQSQFTSDLTHITCVGTQKSTKEKKNSPTKTLLPKQSEKNPTTGNTNPPAGSPHKFKITSIKNLSGESDTTNPLSPADRQLLYWVAPSCEVPSWFTVEAHAGLSGFSCVVTSLWFLCQLKDIRVSPSDLKKGAERILQEVLEWKMALELFNRDRVEFITKAHTENISGGLKHLNTALKEVTNFTKYGSWGLLALKYKEVEIWHVVPYWEDQGKLKKIKIFEPLERKWWLDSDKNIKEIEKVLTYKINFDKIRTGLYLNSQGTNSEI